MPGFYRRDIGNRVVRVLQTFGPYGAGVGDAGVPTKQQVSTISPIHYPTISLCHYQYRYFSDRGTLVISR